MDSSPKTSKPLNGHSHFSTTDATNESRSCTTPVLGSRLLTFSEAETDDSPAHIACTQEGCDNVDVIWDWNSPQAKQRPKRKQKRLMLSQSPKISIKRHPSNNQIHNFEKLREELQSLREEIALPDNEESLVLSPLEEAKYKDVNNDQNPSEAPPLTQDIYLADNDEDMFNDSADDDLILCTQKIEAELEAKERKLNGYVGSTDVTKNTDINVSLIRNVKTEGFNNSKFQVPTIMEKEDSFINVLKKIDIEHLEGNTMVKNQQISHKQVIKTTTNTGFPRTRSENVHKNSRQVGKVEFHRTQSFESTLEYVKGIPKHKWEEIERKRKEAIAKLELKRRPEYSNSSSTCSPEEIEKKRLQALAKLESKRQQEIIERKRQEALKRLQLNRKKNAMVVKSSLTKRL